MTTNKYLSALFVFLTDSAKSTTYASVNVIISSSKQAVNTAPVVTTTAATVAVTNVELAMELPAATNPALIPPVSPTVPPPTLIVAVAAATKAGATTATVATTATTATVATIATACF